MGELAEHVGECQLSDIKDDLTVHMSDDGDKSWGSDFTNRLCTWQMTWQLVVKMIDGALRSIHGGLYMILQWRFSTTCVLRLGEG